MFVKRYSCIVIPSEAEGSFWHTGIAFYVRQQGRGIGESFCERSKKHRSARKISRCARNDGMGGMGLFQVAYNGCVWKALFPYRHPERSRGIFLAGRDNVVCVIAENGNPSAKEARKRGVQGRFLDCARNDGRGEWVYFT